ncbi:MAG: TatD family hydrolase [Deltaproteobacteria bacterium]|nr:TatD family hydrolase [Deltaproteobacteria bacterium]
MAHKLTLPPLVDTHAHLTFDPIWSHLEAVLDRATQTGVGRVLVPAFDLNSWTKIKSLLSVNGIYGAFGIHPWKASENLDVDELRHVMRLPDAVAIGEVGLDFKIETFSKQQQMELLKVQLDVAVSMNKPVMLHCRGAFMELLELIKSYDGRLRGVIHAFSRGPDLAFEFVRLGLHVAFGGAITRPNAKRARNAATMVPWESIVLETDCPSIGLNDVAPAQTEPMHVSEVASELAKLRDTTHAYVAQITTRNAEMLFGLPEIE